MASIIKLKTGTGSAVPSTLVQGEVGINIDNGLIYYGSGSGNSVKQLESFTNITSSGNISSSGTITANEYVGLPSGLLSSSADFATAAQGTKADTAVQPADTSSLLLNTTDTFTGDLTVIGDIIAERYIVSSSVTHLTQSFSSGSTIFGDTQDDTHQFTGSIDITGSITATEYIGLPSGLLSSSVGFVKSINSETPDSDGDISLSTSDIGEHSSNLYYTDTRVKTKLNTENVVSGSASNVRTFLNVEDGADVTDATNVQSAGALMDSEITNLAQVKAFDSSDYATAAQGTKADTAIQPADTGSFLTTVDISDDTNLAGGTNLTLSGDTMNLDANISLTSITASIISASDSITGDLTGTATNATNVNVGNNDGSSTYYILGALGTGNQALKRDSALTFNASTDTLNVGGLDSSGRIYIGASDIELRGDANNLLVYNGGLQAEGAITASGAISASGDITANSFNGIFDGALSSSAQIASDISGSFTLQDRDWETTIIY